MSDTYKTIAEKAEGLYREKGSRFLAFGFPVTGEDEIKSMLAAMRKKYHDARHHCYAYRIGTGQFRYRANDDGEPSGTAGKPIYGQILAHDLTQILIVVVRYFGGTLLGTGGLVHAYRSAAANMLSAATIIQKTVSVSCRLTFPYTSLSSIMKIIKEESIDTITSVYENNCILTVSVPLPSYERFNTRAALVEGLSCECTGRDPDGRSRKKKAEGMALENKKTAKS